ncbi:MAG: hypothetical protein MJY71_01930 [Bacteroidaceae bacterium]|nr:hypothetical protein [Bacteroidaceae bacterium]
MKKFSLLTIFCTVALVFAACSKESDFDPYGERTVVISAGIPGADCDSKVYLDMPTFGNALQPYWSADDSLIVYSVDQGKSYATPHYLTLDKGAGDRYATFKGTISGKIEQIYSFSKSLIKNQNTSVTDVSHQVYSSEKFPHFFVKFSPDNVDYVELTHDNTAYIGIKLKGDNSIKIDTITVNVKLTSDAATPSPFILDCVKAGNGVALSSDGVPFYIVIRSINERNPITGDTEISSIVIKTSDKQTMTIVLPEDKNSLQEMYGKSLTTISGQIFYSEKDFVADAI